MYTLYVILYIVSFPLSHAGGSRMQNQTNKSLFTLPHSTMALPDFTGLYLTLHVGW